MTVRRLFEPEAIAVVGASTTPGKIGHVALHNLEGFDGSVYAVNPSAEGDLLGRPTVPSVEAIDEPVDLALLCVPAPVVPDVLEECGSADVGAAVIYSSGYAEAGEEGLQERIADVAATHDVRLLGPNTSGFLVPRSNLYATFTGGVREVRPGNVAVVAQSGGVAHAIAFLAENEGIGLSAMVGLGNAVDVGFVDVVDYLDDDPATGAIVLHVEGTDTARELLETCRNASTPVVAYKVGESDVDEFARSHTGSLTGDHALYEAGFRQYGVPTVDSIVELLDAGRALADSPPSGGTNVGVVTAQAGPGIIVADRLNRAGASLPSLGERTRDRIEEVLPGITFAENPVDTGRPMPAFGELVETVALDDAVDVVLVYELYEPVLGYPIDALSDLAAEVDKPILVGTGGGATAMREDREALERTGVPVLPTPERLADAAIGIVEYARLSDVEGTPVETARSSSPDAIDRAIRDGRTALTEAETKGLLADLGVDIPEHEVVETAADAVAAVDRLGHPVVVKVSSPSVEHKSEWGNGAGVALGLTSTTDVETAATRILETAEADGIDADILVERAVDVEAGLELLVGGHRDPSFGPVVLVGLGGIHAEVLEDVAHRLAPVDEETAEEMLRDLDGRELLDGYRGRPAVDVERVGSVVRAVGRLLVEHEAIREIDVNPVLATADGAIALDGLVVLDGS